MFLNLVLISLAASAFAGVALPKVGVNRLHLGGRIVGGDAVKIEEIPHQASLLYYNSHMCGASIVGEKYLITAAHCTDGTTPRDLSIRVGTDILDQGETIPIEKFYQNPEYDYYNIDNDLSILELAQPLEFSDKIQPIALCESGAEPADGSTVTTSGWGTLNEGDSNLPQELQIVTVQIVGRRECSEAYSIYGEVTDQMLCAGVQGGGKDACQGDSGGPLVYENTLIGAVSWGVGCAREDFPGVYSNVCSQRLRQFVQETIKL